MDLRMSTTEYILATKQITAFRKLETIANNVANANTNGYKAKEMNFASFLENDKYDSTSYAKIRSATLDFSGGALKRTDNPLDVAINGDGFFAVRAPTGDMLTKDGAFKLNGTGTLVNQNGYPVLTVDFQPIIFEETDTNVLIGEDGTIFVGTQERGKIGIVTVKNPEQNLKSVGNNSWKATGTIEVAEDARMIQGFLETSNVNSIKEIANLTELQRETTSISHLLNENLGLTRNAIKSYSRS